MTPADQRPRFEIVLRPEAGVADPVNELKRALKVLLRSFQMRALSVRQLQAGLDVAAEEGTP